MRGALRTAALVVAFVFVVGVGVASARFQPHGQRKVQVLRGLGPGGVQEPVPPPRCETVWISSVSPFWATDYYAGQRHGPCTKWGSNGQDFLHYARGHWRYVSGGDEFFCPSPHRAQGVPYSILRDLIGCD
jgi:hypothetical protein